MSISDNHQGLSLLYLVALTSCINCFTSQQLHPDERAAMDEIMSTLGAPNYTLMCPYTLKVTIGHPTTKGNGSTTINCNCSFDGNTTCHITELRINGYSLPGKLPLELYKLKYLQTLDLTRNYLNGTIPKEWTSMKSLTYISLAANRLSGNIPSYLSYISSLTYLSLEANQFDGHIPPEIGNLVNLNNLTLSSNQLEGTLPETFAQLKNLLDFRLSDNELNGTIPEFVGNWTNLTRLELYGTGLKGPIPPAIFGLKHLNDLRITDINGTEFQLLNVTDEMQTLFLRNVNLSGTIPEAIWKLGKHLNYIDLSFNKLEGTLPSQVVLPHFLFLGGNMLSGNVTTPFIQSYNEALDLSYNNLSWPSNCQENTHLNTYRSSSSKNLSGRFPCSSFSSCPHYYDSFHINCGGDDTTIKNNYGSLSYEGDREIDGAARNYLNRRNWGFSSTGQYMDNNDEYLKRFTLTTQARLSMDSSQLYSTARIAPVSLTYYGYCLKNGNYIVKLHFAEIQFTDEEDCLKVGTRLFDIYVQGKLEQKNFNIRKAAGGGNRNITLTINTSVMDNTLEIRLYWAGKGTTVIPSPGNYGPLISAVSVCSSHKAHCEGKHSESNNTVLVIGVVVSTLCLVFLAMGVIFWRFYLKDKFTRERDLKGLELQTSSFTLRQLRAATRNFDPTNKLGEGGFGPVYKGELSDGTLIAVKQLSSKSKQGNREFVNEIGMISGLQHPNLVKLYGCCIEGNHLLLVYEYMKNNNLAHALFDTMSESSALKLDWPIRFKICVGIARGLAFLHEECALRIVHRDIKATNVLLDKDLNAKISDFGLAKLNEQENTHISTRVAGTIGYMAPEYALRGYLTEKADIYSFGVLALEIVSGKSNSIYKPQEQCVCLLDLAFVLQENGKLIDIVDTKLGSEFNKEEFTRIAKIALLCTNASPSLRPTMSSVVSMLEGKCPIYEATSDINIDGDGLVVNPLKGRYQQMQYPISSSSQATTSVVSDQSYPAVSSNFDQDLYPVVLESIIHDTNEDSLLL